MSLYVGPDLVHGSVSIGGADPVEVRTACATSDIREDFESCITSAEARCDVLYFSIRRDGKLAGQILLHDIAGDGSNALVAYHLLDRADRNSGVATAALGLLVGYVKSTGTVRSMTALSECGNAASQRVAEKNGFERRGAAPDGTGLVVHVWGSEASVEPFDGGRAR